MYSVQYSETVTSPVESRIRVWLIMPRQAVCARLSVLFFFVTDERTFMAYLNKALLYRIGLPSNTATVDSRYLDFGYLE